MSENLLYTILNFSPYYQILFFTILMIFEDVTNLNTLTIKYFKQIRFRQLNQANYFYELGLINS